MNLSTGLELTVHSQTASPSVSKNAFLEKVLISDNQTESRHSVIALDFLKDY